jgi:hypothetical protein
MAPSSTAGPSGPTFSRRRLWRLIDNLGARAFRRVLAKIFGRVFDMALYGSMALVLGLGTAWYAIDNGTRLTIESDGPWQHWSLAGDPSSDPYTRAHFARAGWLPLAPAEGAYYAAYRDSTGSTLYADCEYDVAGLPAKGRWWSLSAYDPSGRVLPSPTGLRAINAATAMPGPRGAVAIRVSRQPSPGNWLPVSGSNRMVLMLRVYGQNPTGSNLAAAASASAAPPPDEGTGPTISRIDCS